MDGGDIQAVCPECGKVYELPGSFLGCTITCEQCGKAFVLAPAIGATTSATATQPLGDETVGAAPPGQFTLAYARQLWGGSVDSSARPELTIRPEIYQTPSSSTVVVRPRKVVRAGEPDSTDSDFELLDVIGEGGMGVVFRARQMSVDRAVAVKMIEPELAKNTTIRDKFLTEAVVTAGLDHPNIVPVHDLGSFREGALFYAMKEIHGTPWSEVIDQRSRTANLETLLRVADAVAFAHAHDVIHRDLKPANVMLGDYGEVLVLDWGLAVSSGSGGKGDRLSPNAGLAGTPAYMAPEMARGDTDRIGPASDVYLLGAILYEIVSGYPPHAAGNVHECLQQAMVNALRLPAGHDELLEIALHAMATDPTDRFATVLDFQAAVRDYQTHAESLRLTGRADDDLARARKAGDYGAFAQALFGYREALALWPENTDAAAGVGDTELAYARCALAKDDLDLAASLLAEDRPAHGDLAVKVATARKARRTRRRRLRVLAWTALLLVVTVIAVLAVGFAMVSAERRTALAARDAADEARDHTAAALADFQRENYFNTIALAQRWIDEGACAQAEKALDGLPEDLRHWEWHRLKYLMHIEEYLLNGTGPLVFSSDSRLLAGQAGAGTVAIWDMTTSEKVRTFGPHADRISAISFSPDGQQLLVGDVNGGAALWDTVTGECVHRLTGHLGSIVDAAFSPDGRQIAICSRHLPRPRLVGAAPPFPTTGGIPCGVALWDAESGELQRVLVECDPLAAAYAPSGTQIFIVQYHPPAVVVYNVATGEERARKPCQIPPQTVAIDPEHSRIAISRKAEDGQIWVEEMSARQTGDRVLTMPSRNVQALAFVPRSELLVGTSRNGGTYLWDSRSSWPVHEFRGHSRSLDPAVACSPNGGRLATADDRQIRVWRTAHSDVRRHTCRLAIQCDRNGMYAIRVGEDRTGTLFRVSNWQTICTTDSPLLDADASVPIGGLDLVVCEAAGRFITHFGNGGLRLWDLHGKSLGTVLPNVGKVCDLTGNTDGTCFAAVTLHRGATYLGDTATATVRHVFECPQWKNKAVGQAALSGDGGRLMVAGVSENGLVPVWDTRSGQLLTTISTGHYSPRIAFAADGRTVALTTMSADGWHGMLVYDIAMDRPVRHISCSGQSIRRLALTSDGRRLAAAELYNQVYLYDTTTGREILALPGRPAVVDLAFTAGDQALAIGDFYELVVYPTVQQSLPRLAVSTPCRPLPTVLYDSFHATATEQTADAGRWRPAGSAGTPESCRVWQEAGALHFRNTGKGPHDNVLVVANPARRSFAELGELRARLKIEPLEEGQMGAMKLQVWQETTEARPWWAQLALFSFPGDSSHARAEVCGAPGLPTYRGPWIGVDPGEWHTVAMSCSPDGSIVFRIDNQYVGRYVSPGPELATEGRLSVRVGLYTREDTVCTGHVDDVYIAPPEAVRECWGPTPAGPAPKTPQRPWQTVRPTPPTKPVAKPVPAPGAE